MARVRLLSAALIVSCSSVEQSSICPIDTMPCGDGCCRLCVGHDDCDEPLGCCAGVCTETCGACAARETWCDDDGQCHDLATDLSHCGDCVTSCSAIADRADTCRGGECVCGDGGGPCTGDLFCCAGDCVNRDTSSVHCGACDSPCLAPNICLAGSCQSSHPDICQPLAVCQVGDALQCTDTDTDTAHCGDCGQSCAEQYPGRFDSCVLGACWCAAEGTPPCAEGEVCTGVGCEVVPCNPSTCSLGCCDGNICWEGELDNCGTGAGACVDCTADFGTRVDTCVGSCVCQATGEVCEPDQTCTATGCEVIATWQVDDWTGCSEPCGGGTQTRAVWCESAEGTTVDSAYCTETEPPDQQNCNTDACVWAYDDWADCSEPCGGGTQSRQVWCETQDVEPVTVDDSYCLDTEPDDQQECNIQACVTYSWETGNWSSTCNSTCTQRTRTVVCDADPGGTVADSYCSGTKPASTMGCNLCCTPTLVSGRSCPSGQEVAQWFPWGNNNGGTADRASCASQCTSYGSGQGYSQWCCLLYEDSSPGTTWVCRVYDASSTTVSSNYAAIGTCP